VKEVAAFNLEVEEAYPHMRQSLVGPDWAETVRGAMGRLDFRRQTNAMWRAS